MYTSVILSGKENYELMGVTEFEQSSHKHAVCPLSTLSSLPSYRTAKFSLKKKDPAKGDIRVQKDVSFHWFSQFPLLVT